MQSSSKESQNPKKENTKMLKQQKLERKLKNRTISARKQLKEGVSYQTGVAMSYVSDINEIPITTIPPPSCKVHQEDMILNVYCDVETTSIQSDCDIIQLAAVFGDKKSNKYISP